MADLTMKFIFICFFWFSFSSCKCYAFDFAKVPKDITEEYSEQINISGADKLKDSLPEYSLDLLNRANINSLNSTDQINLERVMIIVTDILKNKIKKPIKCILPIISILIFFALVSSLQSYKNMDIDGILKSIISCLVSSFLIFSILKTIKTAVLAITFASNFIFCFLPIFLTSVVASGIPLSASIFNSTIVYCNQIIMNLSKNIVPIANSMASMCIVASISSKVNFKRLFDILYSIIKWILIFASFLISLIFSLQRLVTSSVETAITKEIKFAVGLVPIIGSAIGDAASTVTTSARILSTNVGVFGILSLFFIFLPSILECCVWMASLQFCEFFSQMFELKNLVILFSSLRKTISVVFAIIVICLLIFIFTTSAVIKM